MRVCPEWTLKGPSRRFLRSSPTTMAGWELTRASGRLPSAVQRSKAQQWSQLAPGDNTFIRLVRTNLIKVRFYPDGRPMWVSDVLPGRVNDLAAAREQVFAVLRPFTGQLPCLAGGGYQPAGQWITSTATAPERPVSP